MTEIGRMIQDPAVLCAVFAGWDCCPGARIIPWPSAAYASDQRGRGPRVGQGACPTEHQSRNQAWSGRAGSYRTPGKARRQAESQAPPKTAEKPLGRDAVEIGCV